MISIKLLFQRKIFRQNKKNNTIKKIEVGEEKYIF